MTTLQTNPILTGDSYKFSHQFTIPEWVVAMYSYIEARSKNDVIVPFGLQMWIQKFFSTPLTMQHIDEAEKFLSAHGEPFDRSVWEIIVSKYNGVFPIKIWGIPEGTPIPSGLPIVSIQCDDEKVLAFLGSFLETEIQRGVWYPTTIATNGYHTKKAIMRHYERTVGNYDLVPFACHDFGGRGVSSEETAQIGGAAHLVNFMGSDTLSGIRAANFYYDSPMGAFSVPASEHTIQTLYGESSDGQTEYLKTMLKKFGKKGGIVSIVIDGYDTFREAETLCTTLKDDIIESGAKVVFRPDCYSSDTQILTESGWKLFSEIDLNSNVVQVDSNGKMEFVNPIKVVNEYYEGEMISFRDEKGKVDLLVTPNHRMVFDVNGKEKIVDAESCRPFGNTYSILRSAETKNTGKELTNMERIKIAFQADGSYQSRNRANIRFSFSKKRKIDRLKTLLDAEKVAYKIYDLKDGRVEFNISINAALVQKDFSWVDLKNVSADWCKEFIEELSYWDATRRSETRFKFDTTVKEVIEVVELVAMYAGYGVLISQRVDNRKDIFSDVFTANILKSNKAGGQSIKKDKVDYKGNVVCVTVPSGKIVVKRNRATAVCGNSGDPMDIVPRLLKLQEATFGFTTNEKGYKKINNVGVIQGDGVDPLLIDQLLLKITNMHYAADNIVFGSGGSLLQKVNRDTYKFAQKTSAAFDGESWIGVSKNPITDPGKSSKKGRVKTIRSKMTGEYQVGYFGHQLDSEFEDVMVLMFDGKEQINKITLDEVRKNTGLW